MFAWILLGVSGLLETVWALALSASKGFTKPVPSVIFFIALTMSMSGLALALRTLPVGTGYAVWVGIGATGTAIAGMIWFHEPATPLRLLCLTTLVASVVGLKLLH